MAKTVFRNGTIVTPEFLNSIFGDNADAGHVHDGGSEDGSAPKINLEEHVVGRLPQANMAPHIHWNIETRLAVNSSVVGEGQLVLYRAAYDSSYPAVTIYIPPLTFDTSEDIIRPQEPGGPPPPPPKPPRHSIVIISSASIREELAPNTDNVYSPAYVTISDEVKIGYLSIQLIAKTRWNISLHIPDYIFPPGTTGTIYAPPIQYLVLDT